MLAWAYTDGNRLGLALLCVCAPTTNSRLAPYLCIHACPCYYHKLTYRRCNSSIHLVLKHFACVTSYWPWVRALPGLDTIWQTDSVTPLVGIWWMWLLLLLFVSAAQYIPVHPSTAQYSPVQPSTAQRSPLQPTTTSAGESIPPCIHLYTVPTVFCTEAPWSCYHVLRLDY